MNAGQWNKEIYHVDKTCIVKTFLKIRHRVHLITTPQGFLKTSNLRLLAAFFDITSDPKVYMGRRRLFDNTKIMLRELIVLEYFGKFPTIFLTFKHDETYDLPKMRVILQQLYKQHEFLLSSSRLNLDDRRKFCTYLKYQSNNVSESNRVKFSDAVSVLCDLLHKHYEKRVFVFVDNYDSTILNAISDNRPMTNYLPFLEKMLSSVAASQSVNRLVMTGTTSISRLGTTKVAEFKFLAKHKYTKYFGFSELDLQELAVKCSAEVMEEVEKGCYRTTFNTKIFSPEWVLGHLNYTPIVNPFWYENIVKKQIFNLPALKTKIRLLLLGDDIKFTVNKYKSARDLWLINRLLNGSLVEKWEESDTNLLFSLFLELGLLSLARPKRSTARKITSSLLCTEIGQLPKLVLNETSRGGEVLKTQFST